MEKMIPARKTNVTPSGGDIIIERLFCGGLRYFRALSITKRHSFS